MLCVSYFASTCVFLAIFVEVIGLPQSGGKPGHQYLLEIFTFLNVGHFFKYICLFHICVQFLIFHT